MKKYALALDIAQVPILVVGGGTIALRKIKALQGTGAVITVVAPDILPTIKPLVQKIVERRFTNEDLLGQRLIFCCTDSQTLNHQIALATTTEQLVNNTSARKDSNFYNFATVQHGDIAIHIGSDGQQISAVKAMKDEIMAYLKNKD